MSIPTPMERDFFLCDEVTPTSIRPIVNSILSINRDDDLKEEDYKDWKREPIRLFINSPGGEVYTGLSLVDIIKRSKTPVYTIAVGHTMSMGLWIFMSGHKRFIGENATLMWHDITGAIVDKSEGLRQEINEIFRLQQMSIDSMTQNSLVTEEKLRDYINRKAEWYIPSNEAIQLKLADAYYK